MVTITQSQQQYIDKTKNLELSQPNVPQPKWSPDDFFKQRDAHRKLLFWFALIMSVASLLFLFLIFIFQTYFRVKVNPTFEIISDQGIQIVAAAVFGQIFGVVYVIAHALWSNDEFNLVSKGK